jgi:hypothetical protein
VVSTPATRKLIIQLSSRPGILSKSSLSYSQRLFNYIDENVSIYQLLASTEVGLKSDTAAKALSFVNLSSNEYGKESFPFVMWAGILQIKKI